MKEYKTLAIHSQSDRPGTPVHFEGDPAEKAYESRALTLPNLAVVGLSQALEPSYVHYLSQTLKLQVPTILVPETTANSLSLAFMQDKTATDRLKDKQKNFGLPFALSVFDVTDTERELLEHLQQKEIQIFPEVNLDQAVLLGDKAAFREFCEEYDIPQLPGGVFRTVQELEAFLGTHPDAAVKHPVGTAGQGIIIVTKDKTPTGKNYLTWKKWIDSRQGKGIIAEVFNAKGDEHSLHIYRDPLTKEARVTGMYDQLVTKNEKGVLSHYGCIYPIANATTQQTLQQIAQNQLIPALEAVDYTGPACFDVLSNPTHFMELNARTGANMYLHRMAEQVGKALYQTTDIAFMALVSLPHELTSFADFYEQFADVLQPAAKGTLVLTNPNRHAFGRYDVMAVSPYGREVAQELLFDGLSKIWGRNQAQEFFDNIHKRS